MLGKEPKIKENKEALQYRYCSICKDVIADTYCAESDKNLCKVCAGEACTRNEQHKIEFKNGRAFCKKCGKFVKETSFYNRWINHNMKQFVSEAKITQL